MLLAFTRAVPPSIDRCELTHLARAPIDYARAVYEHDLYERALEAVGCRVERLPEAPDLPDSVFVEDTAVIVDELAVIARPGAPSRRPEVTAVADALRPYRRLAFIEAPATLDGGDVLVTQRDVFVGVSGRTNAEGVRQLTSVLAPLGRRVVAVPVAGCLHLKSAVTVVHDNLLLVNPGWVSGDVFEGFERLEVDPSEPYAANVLTVGGYILCAAEYPLTRKVFEAQGLATIQVPAGELAKAEGGLTCGSVILSLNS